MDSSAYNEAGHFRREDIMMAAETVLSAAHDRNNGIAIYNNEVPAFIEPDLDRLYGARYCSLAHFRIYAKLDGVSTYVVREGGVAKTVYLFRSEPHRAIVLNEGIRVS